MEKFYYEIHVFYGRNDGYSVFMETDTYLSSDDEIINAAVASGVLDGGDSGDVDYTKELTDDRYNEAIA